MVQDGEVDAEPARALLREVVNLLVEHGRERLAFGQGRDSKHCVCSVAGSRSSRSSSMTMISARRRGCRRAAGADSRGRAAHASSRAARLRRRARPRFATPRDRPRPAARATRRAPRARRSAARAGRPSHFRLDSPIGMQLEPAQPRAGARRARRTRSSAGTARKSTACSRTARRCAAARSADARVRRRPRARSCARR